MAVSLNPRAERLLARMRQVSVYSALELALLLLIAIQCARLFWGVMTPIGPVGDFKALEQMRPLAAATPAFGTFDPFFRQDAASPAAATPVVTTLEIRLYGISANRATGGGSAIIGAAGGEQRSFVVGEQILPGVTLSGVGFDFVVITRDGQEERLYLDQSPASAGGPAATQPGVPGPPAAPVIVPPGQTPPNQNPQVQTIIVPPPPPVVLPQTPGQSQ